jgi:pyridoxamine 5'-phosphate oxidase
MNPVEQLSGWLEEARAAGEHEPEAMALATATADGRPSVRYVLCRGLSSGGLRFFTNFEGRKAVELDANPHAAVVFLWQRTGKQVRFEGRVERLGDAEADEYFGSRPRGHQLAAWASPQSRPIARVELELRRDEAERRFAGKAVPRPSFWGGYRLVPEAVELWQRGNDRLHRRTLWMRDGEGWREYELGP